MQRLSGLSHGDPRKEVALFLQAMGSPRRLRGRGGAAGICHSEQGARTASSSAWPQTPQQGDTGPGQRASGGARSQPRQGLRPPRPPFALHLQMTSSCPVGDISEGSLRLGGVGWGQRPEEAWGYTQVTQQCLCPSLPI